MVMGESVGRVDDVSAGGVIVEAVGPVPLLLLTSRRFPSSSGGYGQQRLQPALITD